MNKKIKILLTMVITMMMVLLMQTNRAEAALQSNGATPATGNLNDWIWAVRQMQATGGTLGLTDTISESNLSSSNKNLDIHFQKNTEYGAVAILSASAYGNSEKIADGGTTTGNASGIVVKLNGEWVASGPNDTWVANMKKAAGRYWNNYGSGNGSNAKKGDAMGETNGWHGSSGNSWLCHMCGKNGSTFNSVTGECAFVRGLGKSFFSFYGLSYNTYEARITRNGFAVRV